MKKIVKRIAAMGAAVMMMSSMAIGASAYEAIKYSGYVYASASVGGTGCGSSHSDTGKIEHSFGLKGCTSSKLVKTVHIYNDKVHGNYSTTLSVDSQ